MLAGVGLKSYLGFNNNKSAAVEKKSANSGRPAAELCSIFWRETGDFTRAWETALHWAIFHETFSQKVHSRQGKRGMANATRLVQDIQRIIHALQLLLEFRHKSL